MGERKSWKKTRKSDIRQYPYRKRGINKIAWMMVLTILAGTLTGCGSTGAGNSNSAAAREQNSQENDEPKENKTAGNEQDKQSDDSSKDHGNTEETPVITDGNITFGTAEVSLEPEDEYTAWDESSATKINLDNSKITIEGSGARAEESTIIIEKGGTYLLEGTLPDGKILVDAEDEDKIRLIFNGVEIHSKTSAAVDVKNAGKTIISLEEGSVNTLSDSSSLVYRDEEKEEPNGALFSKTDLTINGSGTLKVDGVYHNGICSKNTLKIAGGILEVTAANHGIKGNDALAIYDGRITITAEEDGVKSDTLAAVLGGNILIHDCEEGIEAETIVISGGTIDLTSRDDGINASTDEANIPQIYLMGGTVTVKAEGDGIDSNGSVHMSGGQVTVYGPVSRDDGALDYDREFTLTGGILAAFGSGGMAQNVSSADTQVSVLVDFQEMQAAGTVTTLRDKDGNELYKGAGEKDFQTVVISVPEMAVGSAYTIEAGENKISFLPEETVIYVNKEGIQEAAAMGRGGPGPRGPGKPGGGMDGEKEGQWRERPEGDPGEKPKGQPGKWDEKMNGEKEDQRRERPEEPPEGRQGERPGEPPEG